MTDKKKPTTRKRTATAKAGKDFNDWLHRKYPDDFEAVGDCIQKNLQGTPSIITHAGHPFGMLEAVGCVSSWLNDARNDALSSQKQSGLELCRDFERATQAVIFIPAEIARFISKYLEPYGTRWAALLFPLRTMRGILQTHPLIITAVAVASGELAADADEVTFCQWAERAGLKLTEAGKNVLLHARTAEAIARLSSAEIIGAPAQPKQPRYHTVKEIIEQYHLEPHGEAFRRRIERLRRNAQTRIDEVNRDWEKATAHKTRNPEKADRLAAEKERLKKAVWWRDFYKGEAVADVRRGTRATRFNERFSYNVSAGEVWEIITHYQNLRASAEKK